MKAYRAACFCLALLVFVVRPASAQKQADFADVTPPELIQFAEAEYPKAAAADGLEAEVVLALDIDSEGRVTHATVMEGAGHGFDEAARAAALKLRFEPARRGDRAVPSRILFRYQFELKPADLPLEVGDRTAQLAGTVNIVGAGLPLAGARITVTGAGASEERITDSAGRWQIAALAPGRYKVTVSAPGYQEYSVTENVAAGESLEVGYRLVPLSTAVDEITVTGVRPSREVTKRSMTRRELSRVPGTSGDALRAIQNLPGVARPPSLSGLLIVRGGGPETTQVLVNGLFLPNPYHFGGLSSVVPTEMIGELHFYPGNFSVRYGRFMAGAVDIDLRRSRNDGRYHGLLQVDLVDARAMLEGPIPHADGWNIMAGVRRSHLDAWLVPLFENQDTDIVAAPVYYDFQVIADTRPSDTSYLRIGVLGSDDRFAIIQKTGAAGGLLDAVDSFWGLAVDYSNQLSSDWSMEATVSAARFHQSFSLASISADTFAWGSVGRAEFSYRLGPRATLHFGPDFFAAPYEFTGSLPPDRGPNASDTGSFITEPSQVVEKNSIFLRPALYAEMELTPAEPTRVISGVRVDYTQGSRDVDVSPRLNARHAIRPAFPKTTLKAGTGLFFQPPGLGELVLKRESTDLRSQRAWQNSLGVEQELTEQVNVSVEGFVNLLDNLISRQPDETGALVYNNWGKGKVFGAELLLRYEADENFFGWLSYTLSRAERTWTPGEASRLFFYDQTHILTALGSYQLGRGWEFGARFRLVTGNLYTPCEGGLFDSASTQYVCVNGAFNSRRVPPFHQLDIRVDKRWVFTDWTLGVYLDLLNAYNRLNPDFVQYNYDYSKSRLQTASVPIVPSLGVRGEF